MTVSTKTLFIDENDAHIEFAAGDNLLDTLNANNISISQSCGGYATCTTCRVLVIERLDNCSERSEHEQERAAERGFEKSERLACQTQINGDLKIRILNPDSV